MPARARLIALALLLAHPSVAAGCLVDGPDAPALRRLAQQTPRAVVASRHDHGRAPAPGEGTTAAPAREAHGHDRPAEPASDRDAHANCGGTPRAESASDLAPGALWAARCPCGCDQRAARSAARLEPALPSALRAGSASSRRIAPSRAPDAAPRPSADVPEPVPRLLSSASR